MSVGKCCFFLLPYFPFKERLPGLHHLPYGSVSHSDSSIEGDLSALVQKTTLPPADNGGGGGGGGGGGREVESYQSVMHVH